MLPATTHKEFVALSEAYRKANIEFPHLKAITLAQWALESGWGGTGLAKRYNNFAGAKWRRYMQPYGVQVQYQAHDGLEWYTYFHTYNDFIKGYWARLDLEPAYKGWREHTNTPEEFIQFIGPIWVGTDDADKARYVRNVLRIYTAYKLADDFKSAETTHEELDKMDFGPTDRSGTPSYTKR